MLSRGAGNGPYQPSLVVSFNLPPGFIPTFPTYRASKVVTDVVTQESQDAPSRLYCSGDLARWGMGRDGEGVMEFLGRSDFQVTLPHCQA